MYRRMLRGCLDLTSKSDLRFNLKTLRLDVQIPKNNSIDQFNEYIYEKLNVRQY